MHRRIFMAALVGMCGASAADPAHSGQPPEVRTISSRPDVVSGGDVLVGIEVPEGAKWTAQLGGRDVTAQFRLALGSSERVALLGGLQPGRNTLAVRLSDGSRSRLKIVSYPIAGPIFSGPHQQPYICQTTDNGLGPASGPDCAAPTVVQYYYKSTEPPEQEAVAGAAATVADNLAPGFKVYNPSGPRPRDVADITVAGGGTVRYIVRRELGVINRAVYDIQFLHQPGQPLPTPWSHPTPGWNRRLVYVFDGGCGAGYRQGTFVGAVGPAQEPFLSQAYATATSTLNRFANGCNDRVSAETMSMVKEHFIKQYGEPVHTIGWGDSGGAMELNLTAQNYPGLLDGIIPGVSFPDMTGLAQSVTDCALLDHALGTSTLTWSEEQKSAVAGFASWRTCHPTMTGFVVADPRNFCPPLLPKELIYDRKTNPTGTRCDIYDNEINVFGRDPRTGFARRPLDNVGVQYGLLAFNSGKIDAERFVDLNERVGGYDDDGSIVATRTQADEETIRIAYRRGLVLTGRGGLNQVPIIEWRPYGDDLADAHDRIRSLATRARLIAANGTADNQVILVYPRLSSADFALFLKSGRLDAPFAERERNLVRQMDRWLDNIAADHASEAQLAKIIRNRPADLADSCWATDGEQIVEPASYDGTGRCNQLYPSHANPRMTAGGPLADDVLKCALKPISPLDYPRSLTSDQLRRLAVVFRSGVCDYSRPGVGQEVTMTAWQRYDGEPDKVVKASSPGQPVALNSRPDARH
jgi:hypothetical protein